MDLFALIKQLSEANGVSGHEDRVREVARKKMKPYCDDIREDAMGSLIGLRRGSQTGTKNRRSIMLAGHMDEIGFMVTKIEEGFIRFTQIGGYDVRILPGHHINVHGSKKTLPGVIGALPPHITGAGAGVTPMDELFIDVGMSAKEVEKHVNIGDWATLDAPCVKLDGDYVCGKTFDDRAGVAAILICLDELSKIDHSWDVYAVATVQEEIGIRGAFTSSFGVNPDVGIAIDVGFGKQPGVPEDRAETLGKGPTMHIGPNIHPALFRHIKDTAKLHEIPVQEAVSTGGTGTDANAIQITRSGIPTMLFAIPIRNMHTPVETINTKDLRRCGRLMALSIAAMDKDFMDTLTWTTPKPEGDKNDA
jgi:endoglucanase